MKSLRVTELVVEDVLKSVGTLSVSAEQRRNVENIMLSMKTVFTRY